MGDQTAIVAPSAFPHLKRRPWMSYYTFAHDGDFTLQSGERFGPITVAYETYGTLNATRDNAVLIPHALTGDSHCANHGDGDEERGWWEDMVGPGRPFDTEKYFVICPNVLGGCQGSTGPSTINPKTGRPYGSDFPTVTILDMVRVQRELLRHLGIERLRVVAGGSMGGMQVLQWGITYPHMMDALIPVATPARSYPQAIAWNEVGRQAIFNDPGWHGGHYYGRGGPDKGLSIARMLGMITYQSDESMHRKFSRDIMSPRFDDLYAGKTQFAVESYLHYQGKKLVGRFDANTYVYLTRALDLFDVSLGYRSLEKALARIVCPTLVIGVSSDFLYPTYQQKEIVDALQKAGTKVAYKEIVSPYGHDGFLIEFDQMTTIFNDFLTTI